MGHWDRINRIASRTQSMLEGWTEEEATLAGPHVVNAEALTSADIAVRLKRFQQAHAEVDRCRMLLAYAIDSRDAQLDAEQLFQESLGEVLRQALGSDWERLQAFGVTPRKKRRPLTSEEVVVKQERARLTRQARNTMGSRQRLAITAEPQPTVRVVGLEAAPPPVSNEPTPAAAPTGSKESNPR